jgi:hypothetical protein
MDRDPQVVLQGKVFGKDLEVIVIHHACKGLCLAE